MQKTIVPSYSFYMSKRSQIFYFILQEAEIAERGSPYSNNRGFEPETNKGPTT